LSTEFLPLAGLRVTELCWVWSGPMVGQHLADLGAEVVKVEWYDRFDLYRTRGVESLRGKLPERERRESSFSFQSLNRNKFGFAADLKSEGGLELVRQLIAKSDLLLENFTVGTLERLGLGPEALRALNPPLVVVSLSATGRGSRVESMRGYGPMLSALGGYEALVVDEAGDFVGSPCFVMSDPNAGLFGVFAALAGMLHARQSGRGASYECSQVEAVASLVGAPPPEERPDSSSGIFATADASFVALSLEPGLEQQLAPLEPWVAQRNAKDVVETVRGLGGAAAEVRNLAELETSSEFEGREISQSSKHPVSGDRELVAAPWWIDGRRSPVRQPAPCLGEHNEHVLRDVLGLDDASVQAVHASGVVDDGGARED
jgi:crotonobetainyl-CoA:carnitine CoA-transferase CaiB-like acyl-CoA transferase